MITWLAGFLFLTFISVLTALSKNDHPVFKDHQKQFNKSSDYTSGIQEKQPGVILVRDFGAIPGDGRDDSKAIIAAIDKARTGKIKKVIFEAGVYEFRELPGWERTERKRSCYITVQDISGLELCGAVDAQGRPATIWMKDNDMKECQPMILSIEKGSDITVRNIKVDMSPYYYSAGKVLSVAGDEVTIEVLPGHPYIDGQKAFIMGLYNFEDRKATVVRLTWESNLPEWHITGDPKQKRMNTRHAPLAQSCKAGDGVFWFQGNYTGSLLNFGFIDGLLLENIHLLNGHGFPLTCRFCHDITYRKVSLKPEGNRITTACRDGFKIYCGSGKILMDRVHVEGCLGDDGQNIHGTWLAVARKQSEKALYTTGSMVSLTPGKEIVLFNDQFRPAWRSVIESCTLEGKEMLISFKDPVPAWVHENTPVEPQEWLPDSLHIINCVYRTTGRFGIYLKASNTLIENCLFQNNVAGIHIGGEWSPGYWLESTNSQHVEIRNCIFRDNKLDIRFGGQKMDVAIDINAWTVNTPGQMRDIRIHNNIFEDEALCLSLQNCSNIWFWNNQLKNCGKDVLITDETVESVFYAAP